MSLKIIELRKVCEFLDNQRIPVTDSDRKAGPYPYYGANGLQDRIDGYIFNEPLVLLAEDGGHFGSKTKPIAYKIIGKCWVNNHAHVLRPKSNCDVDYLHRILSFYDVTNFVNGTTREKLTKNQAERILIPLPPLPEQKRIAAILEKTDRLRRQRRYALELSYTYLQTVFLEMFGDPVTNPKGWNLAEISHVCNEIYRYPTFYGFQYVEKGTPVVRIGNILSEGFLNPDLKNYVFVEPEVSIKFPRTILELNDIVMAVRGDGSTVSRIGLLNSKNLVGANISPNLLLFRANKDVVSPLYLFHLITSDAGQKLLEAYITRTAKKTITAEDIKQIKIPVPTYFLQEKFAEIVQKYQRLLAQQREAERQAEHLFQTLLHRAFQGELELEDDAGDLPEEQAHYTIVPEYALTTPAKLVAEETAQLVLPME